MNSVGKRILWIVACSAIAVVAGGCIAEHVTLVQPGDPVKVVKPFNAPGGTVATYHGHDKDGNAIWNIEPGGVVITPGRLIVNDPTR